MHSQLVDHKDMAPNVKLSIGRWVGHSSGSWVGHVFSLQAVIHFRFCFGFMFSADVRSMTEQSETHEIVEVEVEEEVFRRRGSFFVVV